MSEAFRQRILLINPNLKMGGTERVVANTANLLTDDYEVSLVVFDGSDAIFVPSCEIIDINVPAGKGLIIKLWNVLKRSYRIRKIKQKKEIDISISFGPSANLVNALSRNKEKVISELRAFVKEKTSIFEKYVFKRSDLIVCCSKEIERKIHNECNGISHKTRVIYNPFDIDEIKKLGDEKVYDYSFGTITLVAHGRLDPIKGYPRLIRAFSIVKKTVDGAQLLIIGSGSDRNRLESVISDYGLEDSVTLLGFKKNPYAYLSKATLYIMNSYSEGFPNSLVEGMVFLPAISTDCPSGPREIMCLMPSETRSEKIEYADYGVLVPCADISNKNETIDVFDEYLAEAIVSLLSSSEELKKYKLKASERTKDFSVERYVDALKSCFED